MRTRQADNTKAFRRYRKLSSTSSFQIVIKPDDAGRICAWDLETSRPQDRRLSSPEPRATRPLPDNVFRIAAVRVACRQRRCRRGSQVASLADQASARPPLNYPTP